MPTKCVLVIWMPPHISLHSYVYACCPSATSLTSEHIHLLSIPKPRLCPLLDFILLEQTHCYCWLRLSLWWACHLHPWPTGDNCWIGHDVKKAFLWGNQTLIEKNLKTSLHSVPWPVPDWAVSIWANVHMVDEHGYMLSMVRILDDKGIWQKLMQRFYFGNLICGKKHIRASWKILVNLLKISNEIIGSNDSKVISRYNLFQILA